MNANCAQNEILGVAATAMDSIQIRMMALGRWGTACSHGEGGGRCLPGRNGRGLRNLIDAVQ